MNRLFHITLILLLFTAPLSAQFEQLYENWRWAHFTTKDGLPSNHIEEVVETKNNTVWVITPEGAAWYDGFRWNSIYIDSLLADRHIRQMLPFKGKLLVNAGGRLFFGDQMGFTRITMNPRLDSGFIRSICPIDNESFLCTIEYDQIALLVKVTGTKAEVLDSPSPGKLFATRSASWFLGHDQEFMHHLYQYENGNFTRIKAETGQPNAIRTIVENEDGEGVLAMDAPKQSIGLWEYSHNKQFTYSESERNQPIRCLDISQKGEVIAAYESGEIHVRHEGKWGKIHPLPSQLQNVLTIKYRSNNDVWFGTEDGLYLFKRSVSIWSTNSTTFSDLRNVVMEVFRSSDGDIWIGTMDGVEIQSANGEKSFVKNIMGQSLGLVTGINQDKQGRIWISSGAGFHGAFCWDKKQWVYHKIHHSDIGYHKIRKDKSGALWFLGLGIRANDPAGFILENNRWLRIDSLYKIPGNRLYDFDESVKGVKWIGSSMGLTRIKNNIVSNWGREELGRSPKVYSLAVDKSENVWFSTFSPLLGRISENDSLDWIWTNDEVYHYEQKIWDLVVDESDVLWIASTKGLYSYNDEVWTNYNMQTGVSLKELRTVLPTNEKVYIGGHGIGFRSMTRFQSIAPIRIIISRPIVESNDLYCSWHANAFWGGLASGQIETRYKIDSGEWSAWGSEREITLRGLRSGDHVLTVQGKDSFGKVRFYTSTAEFYVEPPVFLRTYIAIPFTVLFLLLVFSVVRYKQAQKAHALQIYNQRTRIANDLHDEVGSNLASIALISRRLWKDESLPAILREELEIIRESAAQTGDFLRDIVWYINPQYDSFMSLETRLREIAGRMLRDLAVQIDMSNTSGEGEPFVENRRNIILMFKEIVHNIVKHAQSSFVIIQCERSKEHFRLSVKDNGVGFHQEVTRSGSGLLSLKRRARDAGAELIISSKLGEGTTITITFMSNVPTL